MVFWVIAHVLASIWQLMKRHGITCIHKLAPGLGATKSPNLALIMPSGRFFYHYCVPSFAAMMLMWCDIRSRRRASKARLTRLSSRTGSQSWVVTSALFVVGGSAIMPFTHLVCSEINSRSPIESSFQLPILHLVQRVSIRLFQNQDNDWHREQTHRNKNARFQFRDLGTWQ